MSEYWKSNPRKFCDFCKCWIADNKPSVEFHERGKRHKENVTKRLAEMGRKSQEEYEAKQHEDDFLKAMEEGALKAYKSDLEQNPDMTGNKIKEIAAAKNAEIVVGKKEEVTTTTASTTTPPAPTVKTWYEANTPEGQSYYWNIETGESKWEAPEEGYLSVADQEKLKKKTKSPSAVSETNKTSNDPLPTPTTTQESRSKKSSLSSEPILYGPAPKAEAYSKWNQIQRQPEQTSVDYQLPQVAQEEYYVPDVSFKHPEVSFKEKTVTLSAADSSSFGSVEFKKRKAAQDHKKSMRRRTDDL